MDSILDHWRQEQIQSAIIDTFSHSAAMSAVAIQAAAGAHERPSVLYRPRLSKENGLWRALYGDNPDSGVAGYGATPAEAMYDFDKRWTSS